MILLQESWNVGGPYAGVPPFVSMSMDKLVIIAMHAVSKRPKKRVAVNYEKIPTMAHGPILDVISSISLVIVCMMKRRLKMLAITIPIFPTKMKIFAIKFANVNYKVCFTFSKNPCQADFRKGSPATAM